MNSIGFFQWIFFSSGKLRNYDGTFLPRETYEYLILTFFIQTAPSSLFYISLVFTFFVRKRLGKLSEFKIGKRFFFLSECHFNTVSRQFSEQQKSYVKDSELPIKKSQKSGRVKKTHVYKYCILVRIVPIYDYQFQGNSRNAYIRVNWVLLLLLLLILWPLLKANYS